MKTYKITKQDLDFNNHYTKTGIIDGHLEADENLGTVYFNELKVSGYIYFKAGSGIEAGGGIKAGFNIVAKTISSKLRIFAGTCNFKIPTEEEIQIKVEKVINGDIAFGELVIINPEVKKVNSCNNKVVEIDGIKYRLVAE
jgi:hypothetical protein